METLGAAPQTKGWHLGGYPWLGRTVKVVAEREHQVLLALGLSPAPGL